MYLTGLSAVLCFAGAGELALDKLRAVVTPTAREQQWLAVGWRTDLWAAREEAAKSGKPILLWEMDGHPLGCT
ncbi:MAG TPA: hypothetical protein VNC50_00565 [Planctomycetia bacterium]|nr:hypothetical protein [Planctomycetia bacterium]